MLKIWTILSVFLLSFGAYAQTPDIYDAEVEIDAEAANAADAREKAMKEANRKAVYTVAARISNTDSEQILAALNDNQILNFIREVSVLSEKVTDTRYIASLKISINEPILTAYLSEKDVPFTSPQNIAGNEYSSLTAVFNYNTLKEWLTVKEILQNISSIEKNDVETLASGYARLSIEYAGTLDNLQEEFAQNGLKLIEDGDNYLIERM